MDGDRVSVTRRGFYKPAGPEAFFILQPQGEGWATTSARTRYRALKREELSRALTAAGFRDVRWLMPEASGFYQPLVMARRG